MRPVLPTRRVAVILLVNVAVTVLTAAAVGPSVGKLRDLFGMIGWLGRLPFYLIPLYLGPLVLWIRPRVPTGIVLGLLLAIPLAMWSLATMCPPFVPVAYVVSGMLQGGLLSRLACPGADRGGSPVPEAMA